MKSYQIKKHIFAGLLVVAAVAPMEVGAMEQQLEQNKKSLSQQIHEEKVADLNARKNDDKYFPADKPMKLRGQTPVGVNDEIVTSQPLDVLEAVEKVADENARHNDGQYGPANTDVSSEAEDETISQQLDTIEADEMNEIMLDSSLSAIERKVALKEALEAASYADVNTRNSYGDPNILSVGSDNEDLNLLKYLVEKGANVKAIGHSHNVKRSILSYKAFNKKFILYCVQNGFEINKNVYGGTVMHLEVKDAIIMRHQNFENVKFLFENNADPLFVDDNGLTPRALMQKVILTPHVHSNQELDDYLVLAEDLQRLFDNTITINTFIVRRLTVADKKVANKNLVETIKLLLARGYYGLIEKLFAWDKKKCSIVIQAIDPNITAEPGKDLWFLQLCRYAIAKEKIQLFTKIATDKPQLWKTIENVIYESPELNQSVSKFKKMFGAGDGDFTKKPTVNYVKTLSLLKDAWEKADEDMVREPILNFMSKKNAVAKITCTDNTFENKKVVKTEKKTVPNEVVANIIGFLGNK